MAHAARHGAPHAGPIVFYDGACGLCAGLVQWTLRRDARRVLRFAPLQGTTYRSVETATSPGDPESMVLLDAGGLHRRSTAALRLLRHLGGVWGVLGAAGMIVPRPIRDGCYTFIAARRTGWFGPADHCAVPSHQHSNRFLP